MAFLASGRIKQAIVADIYQPRGYSNLRAAWAPDAKIEHRHVDLRTAGWLRNLMEEAGVEAAQTVVTACHACGVLADELIHECLQAEVSFAVVPCCHGEKAGILLAIGCAHTAPSCVVFAQGARGEMLRKLAKEYQLDRGLTYDMLRLGAIDAAPGYIARLRQIDAAITPKNRILLGLHKPEEAQKRREQRRANLDRLAQTAESLCRSQRSILVGRSAKEALFDQTDKISLPRRSGAT
ncbi:rsmH [Symbiodinium sp. CCMP2592]|nr:rsmH [Symbiodinium sp. CCMP2592]